MYNILLFCAFYYCSKLHHRQSFRCATRNISGQGRFRGTRGKKAKNKKKKAPHGKILDFFLLDTLKNIFWMENLTQIWTQSRPFFPKSGQFFRINISVLIFGHSNKIIFLCSACRSSSNLSVTQREILNHTRFYKYFLT